MSVAAMTDEPLTGAGSTAPGHGSGGPASTRIVVSFGFWVFLLSDIIMFAALFAAHAVLASHTAGGPSGRQIFYLPRVAVETGCLLLSSFTCGLLTVASNARNRPATYGAAAMTFVLGAIFLGLEFSEFSGLVARGFGPSRSAFLSSFFALVGAHGAHVTAGLTFLAVMMAQVATRGFRPSTLRRLYCFCLFWHALDIVWVAVFTVVYLMGVAR
jgi:cytochrome o ubiquinol oxidase subunit III